jgi:hypothetical protein
MPVAKFVKGVQHPYAQLRKLVAKNKQNGISPERTVTDWIHKNTNYEHIGKTSRAVEGAGGEHYKTQLQGIYDMLLDGIEPDKVDKDLMDGLNLWRDGRVGRDSSYAMPHTVAAAAAVAGSGAASAGEEPLLGPGIPSAFGPQGESQTPEQRGFTPWSDYEPQPSYLDRVTSLDTYRDALAPYARGLYNLSQTAPAQYMGGKIGERMEQYDSVGGFARGVGRGMYGAFSGESPSQAWDAGVRVSNQPADVAGDGVEQWALERGWHPTDAAAAGIATEYMTNPLDYIGMGAVGSGIKRGFKGLLNHGR